VGPEHLTVDDRLYNWLAAAEAVTERGLDWFGIGHKGPMRSGCDRAADMMLIRTGRRRFFGIDDANRPRGPGITCLRSAA